MKFIDWGKKMLKYAVIPLLFLTLTGCFIPKKSNRMSSSSSSMHFGDSGMQVPEMGMDEYYGCQPGSPIAVINFDFDKSVVSDKSKAVLEEAYSKCIHDYLMNNPDAKLLITGHTDRHGTVEYNLALGSRRSDAAHRALHSIASGYHPSVSAEDGSESRESYNPADIMKTKSCQTSKGKEEMLHGEDVPDADLKNRRVVLEFVDKSHCE